MKLSKFVKRAKSESYCMVIHADDSGIWLGTRLALYNATELPEMEGKEQVGAVLDIDSKAWEKMFFDEKYAETAGAAFGVNLTDADPLEQEARRVPLEMFYKGMGLVGLMYGNGGELIFYDSALIAPIADVVKNSDYIQTVVRKTAGGAPYVVIKDGFEVLAGFVPLKIIGALNTIRENILNLYTKKTGREKDEVAAWMDATSWWTGEEAKTNGFVDELVDDGEKTVVENRGGLLFVNSVNMNLPFDKAPKFVQNSVAAAPAASGFVNTQTPAEQPGNNSHKEDTNMANEIKTVDELRGAYPALVDQIEQAAALRATNAERQRIRDIEEMALPGSEQITNEAKYDKPMSASDYAKAAMKNAKEQGAAWLNTMQQGANASGVNSVGSATAPTGGEKPDEFMDAIKGLGKKQ